MNLWSKISIYLDYNNIYSVKRVLSLLEHEFNLAVSGKNRKYAHEVINMCNKIHDGLCDNFKDRENLDFLQRSIIDKTLYFTQYLVSRLKIEF